VALAQALVTQPDVLLLDEPTNHLDLDSIQWLEQLLIDFKGSVVAITHDRAFLDRVATRIVELDRAAASYPGNFSAPYLVLKEEQLAQEAVIKAKADKLLAQEEIWIRKGVEARRTRAQARIVRLGELRAKRQARRAAVGSVHGREQRRGQRQAGGRAHPCVQDLRRAPHRGRLFSHDPARRQDRPAGAQWCRQDHLAQADPG
jgi:ATP-binding cassette subfamily F protein uup